MSETKAGRNFAQLQKIIGGLSEGIVLFDTGLRTVWANAAALQMHGAEALEELGTTLAEHRERFRFRFRNNHELDAGAHPVEAAANGDEEVEVVVEVFRAAAEDPEWVHSIRCEALRGDDGEVECYAMIVADESRRFEAEERFESAFNANPAPALICRLEDACFIKVNMGFLEMTGYTREALIGRPLGEIDIFTGAENRETAEERFREGRMIPQMEACLPLPGGGSKFVILTGEPIELQEKPCMLFCFADLDPRKKAEAALRQSEERFAKSFRLSPVPTAICLREDLKVLNANDAFLTLAGDGSEEIIGRSIFDKALAAPSATVAEIRARTGAGESLAALEVRLDVQDGSRIDCLLSTEHVQINDEDCVLVVLQDITERKRTETELMTAIEKVMTDASWFSRSVVEKLASVRQGGSGAPGPGLDDLSMRERDILGLIAEGRSDAAMSEILHLSPNTIRNHVASLYRKIGVNRRTAAAIWARERGVTGRTKPARKPAKR